MEWVEHLNQAVDYIEEHLTQDFSYEEPARVACCSVYHFQRMFAYLAGVPLSEYIRRRRMSLAAAELQGGGLKIVDAALKYGYTSPTAFNRAFQSVHSVAPSQAVKGGVSLRSYPPIRFSVVVKGAQELNYRVISLGAFRVVGLGHPLDKELEKNFEVVPTLWGRVAAGDTLPRLLALMDGQPQGVLGVSACYGEQWRYLIAVSSGQPAPQDFESYEIPAFTWAVFPGQGACPGAIQALEQRIITEWLPTSGYEYADGPDLEVYRNPDPQNAQFEVWIPVSKK